MLQRPADLSSGDVAAALAALVSKSTVRPGSSWRVGVGKNLQQQDLLDKNQSGKAGLAVMSGDGGAIKVRRAAKDRIKPAIMTVRLCAL